jgi:hypothetical protein
MTDRTSPPATASSAADAATRRTLFAVDLEVEHAKKQNLVWSAGMAIAWKELVALAGGPIVLAGAAEDDRAAYITRALNTSQVDRSVVDEASCVARAGFQTERFLQEVRDEIARKFADPSPSLLPSGAAPDLFMAYAYLQQRMAFELPLYRTSWPLQFRDSIVESFGLWRKDAAEWPALSRQVRVHHPCYTEADVERMSDAEYDVMYDEFVVELVTTRPTDRLIVAMLAPGATLGATVARTISMLDRHPADHPHARIGPREKLEVPIIDLDLARRYDELFGRRVENAPLSAQQFGELIERLRFRLDEGGALLQTEAVGRGLSLPPRELVCYSPFLVMVLRQGARLPMFALWVENSDVLVPTTRPERARAIADS